MVETGICMALWLLRGNEAAALLAEQAFVELGVAAFLNLGPTKMDPTGSQAPRRLHGEG